jgi:hypothetical protein
MVWDMRLGEDTEKAEGVEKLFRLSFAEACEDPLWADCGWVVVYTHGLSSDASSGLQGRSFCTRIVLHGLTTRKNQNS